MKKASLSKKLASYSAVAGSLLATGGKVNAQIIYTNVNPDSTTSVAGNSYLLDLDNDGNYDFDINLFMGTASGYTSQRVSITGTGSNAPAGDTVGIYVYPFAMNPGDTIQASLQFNYTPSQSMGSYFGPGYTYGNWAGVNDKYLGLSFYIGAARHYGWARLDVNLTATQFTIKDYAYNAVADQYILAGQGITGIQERTPPLDVQIFSSSANVSIRFMKELPKGATVRITNLLGQEILKEALSQKETRLSLSEQDKGIYFVSVLSSIGTTTQKVLIR